MVLLGRSAPQVITKAIKSPLAPLGVPRDEDALDIFTLAEALTYRPKLGRKVGVYEEDLHGLCSGVSREIELDSVRPRGP